MKKLTSIFLSLVMVLSVTGVVPVLEEKAYADKSGIYTYTVKDGEATIGYCAQYVSGILLYQAA